MPDSVQKPPLLSVAVPCYNERRFERDELIAILPAAGFEVEDTVYQNRAAKLACRLNSRLFNRNALPAAQSKMSLIAIGRKAGGAVIESVAEDAATAPAAAPTFAGAS